MHADQIHLIIDILTKFATLDEELIVRMKKRDHRGVGRTCLTDKFPELQKFQRLALGLQNAQDTIPNQQAMDPIKLRQLAELCYLENPSFPEAQSLKRRLANPNVNLMRSMSKKAIGFIKTTTNAEYKSSLHNGRACIWLALANQADSISAEDKIKNYELITQLLLWGERLHKNTLITEIPEHNFFEAMNVLLRAYSTELRAPRIREALQKQIIQLLQYALSHYSPDILSEINNVITEMQQIIGVENFAALALLKAQIRHHLANGHENNFMLEQDGEFNQLEQMISNSELSDDSSDDLSGIVPQDEIAALRFQTAIELLAVHDEDFYGLGLAKPQDWIKIRYYEVIFENIKIHANSDLEPEEKLNKLNNWRDEYARIILRELEALKEGETPTLNWENAKQLYFRLIKDLAKINTGAYHPFFRQGIINAELQRNLNYQLEAFKHQATSLITAIYQRLDEHTGGSLSLLFPYENAEKAKASRELAEHMITGIGKLASSPPTVGLHGLLFSVALPQTAADHAVYKDCVLNATLQATDTFEPIYLACDMQTRILPRLIKSLSKISEFYRLGLHGFPRHNDFAEAFRLLSEAPVAENFIDLAKLFQANAENDLARRVLDWFWHEKDGTPVRLIGNDAMLISAMQVMREVINTETDASKKDAQSKRIIQALTPLLDSQDESLRVEAQQQLVFAWHTRSQSPIAQNNAEQVSNIIRFLQTPLLATQLQILKDAYRDIKTPLPKFSQKFHSGFAHKGNVQLAHQKLADTLGLPPALELPRENDEAPAASVVAGLIANSIFSHLEDDYEQPRETAHQALDNHQ